MIKVLLFDADGVVLEKFRYFSEIYAEKHNISSGLIRPFFNEKFALCQKGKLDLKAEITPHLKQWGWNKTAQEFLDYWFTTDVKINSRAIDCVNEIRKKGFRCYLATDQEKYRAQYIKEAVGSYFDHCFFSCDLGHIKIEKEFFVHILDKLNLKGEEVIYWDDDSKNLAVAKNLGIKAIQYNDFSSLTDIVTDL